ncbi:colicin immunity protein [Pseudomonas gingeri NCPPB 3146 = LMG 5327]|uniref:Colicin immunity protein n=2 Tax=Pseudomonas gingeri TaxID=117681 RepID=A0A7Y8CB61_9PSED|nr:colicin immunity domain-containing protein [Pseudomonas gingeri]NWC12865.1 colicin immunity protein [Pseudomonas gingeri]NWE48660.1 colicin immunity protein [Pseudomonas gingeri]NWE67738.1 colicin immunity protein [Pseudomonas gingeri]PNQ94165.1 colicin immunity protein [Pseudomonas gingeri NCPPB 3146 = LMG 5327]
MSMELVILAKTFVSGGVPADQFAKSYMKSWKSEGEGGFLQKDDPELSECCSDIFMHADCYQPEPGRDESETDEGEFRKRVRDTLDKFKLI